MALKVRPAAAGSDQGGSVRLAGGGIIDSLRSPWPFPVAPWQMAQLAAKSPAPARWASVDARIPCGGADPPVLHPEMTGKSVDSAIATASSRLRNQLVAKSVHFQSDSGNQGTDRCLHDAGARH
jgi:hypothetical protein